MAFLISTETWKPQAAVAVERTATPTKPDAPAASSRYQSLDLWRGAACLCLVLFHTTFYIDRASLADAWSLAEGVYRLADELWIGVPIFFVVSGYCIAASVASRQKKPYAVSVYFTRRLRRIYPPLWVACLWAVVFTLLIATLWPLLYAECRHLPRLGGFSVWNWLGNLTASESWQHHVSGSPTSYLLKNTWTLCLEEQFYVVCGLLIWMSNRHFYLGAAVVTAITLACRHAGQVCGLGLEGSFLDGYWVMFASGVLLHYLLNRAGSTGRVIGGAVLVLGMAYAVADRLFWADNAGERHMASYIFVGCGFGLALAWLRRFDAAWSKAMWAKPFFWCGQRSYSIYLAHYPVVVTLSCALHLAGMETPWEWLLVVMPTCLAASLVSGWLFYQLVERHFLNLAPPKAAKPLVNIPLALVDRGVTVAEPTRAYLSS